MSTKKKAVCIRCGTFKKDAFAPCPGCGLRPQTDFETARALILSEKSALGSVEIGRTLEELESISESIKKGRPYAIDGEEQNWVVREYWNYLKSLPAPKRRFSKFLIWSILLLVLFSAGAAVIGWFW